jgi:hypothetical protein
MLSKILKHNYEISNDNDSFIYLFEEGKLSENDIAQEIVPFLKKYDSEAKGKIRMLSDLNEINIGVPEILVKAVSAGEGTSIVGLIFPSAIHERAVQELTGLGYEFS